MSDMILEVKDVTKKFPGVVALDHISLSLKKGEVMAVCGENGAGKSTLMKILSGSYTEKEYEGDVFFNGQKTHFQSVRDAKALGIEMVYQELNMVLTASVAENMFLDDLPSKGPLVQWKSLYKKTEELLVSMGMEEVRPDQIAGRLNSGQLQLISIMRGISHNPKLIVFDEPTSSLTDAETKVLFREINRMKEQGTSVLFISHKLDEVFTIADRVTVMRDGAFISTDNIKDIDEDTLIERMVGRKIENQYPKTKSIIGDEVLRVEHLTVPHPSIKGKNIVDDVSFSLRKGEILGIGGLVGAGRSETLGGVFGQYTKNVNKRVYIDGQEVSIKSPKEAKSHGISFVTEERRLTGFIPNFNINYNLSLCWMDKLLPTLFINRLKEKQLTGAIFNRLGVKAPSINTMVTNLSGGNQQKVVLGKWLIGDTKILFIDEPTKGIDVQSKTEIYKLLCELTAQGVGIVMVSSDMPELINMSDRCIVLSEGRITGEFLHDEVTQESIMRAAISEEK